MKNFFLDNIFFFIFFGILCFFAFTIIQIKNDAETERKQSIQKEQKDIASCKEPMLFKTDTLNEKYSLFSYVCQDSNVIVLNKPILGAKISPYLK